MPVSERRAEVAAAIAGNQVVIVAGETGSGKSTQIPKICLDLGRGAAGLVGHTQPRRIAARAVAERVASELGTEIGGGVGYAVRFTDRVGPATMVKVMTDGILLAEVARDRRLSAYDTIIVDEAHERSLNIDFLLGYIKRLLPERPDLKVVVTSATIDTDRFAAHFDGAPVVSVAGRSYPVELRYRPLDDGGADQVGAVCDAVAELRREGPGDILVFLSGEREIRDTSDALAALAFPDTEVVPLFARLALADQHRVFRPHPGRRVVLATNVAETSLTVPGIRYVIDCGTARISRYNRRTKVQRLPIEAVSRASADQRAGRCGRVAPGICIRLYSEDDFANRAEYTEAEVLRTNLAAVILRMAALDLGDVSRFPFLDPPDARNIRDGIALLEELGALSVKPGLGPPGDPAAGKRDPVRGLDPARRLTPLGRRLARLPVDPRLGRMVLEAEREGCLPEVLVIAAALSVQDPRERPLEQAAAAAASHLRFADPTSDFLSYLNLWDYLAQRQEALTSSAFRRLCRAEFLHYLRVREWQDLEAQLRRASGGATDRPPGGADQARRGAVHRSLLAGLLSQVGMRPGDARDYLGARDARFAIAGGSGLAAKPPRWVMAAELVETNRLWARVVARIEPAWLERLGGDLVKRSYGEPYWDRGRGCAMAVERATLYGLPIVTDRPVTYERVDPAAARDLFLRHALVDGDWDGRYGFVEHNRRLVEEVRALEVRARRRDMLAGPDARVAFFDARVGTEVTSAGHFERWWKQAQRKESPSLEYTAEALVDSASAVGPGAFPDTWAHGELALPLRYEFDPSSEHDGVTVTIPLTALPRVRAVGFDWGVPGHREELATELIRSLPKGLRRAFVPASDYARAALAGVDPAGGPLAEVLARALSTMTGDPLPATSFDWPAVPRHLRLSFVVTDGSGATIAAGKDLDALRATVGAHLRAALRGASHPVVRRGATTWEFGAVPAVVAVAVDGRELDAYPALVDEGDTVGVALFAAAAEAAPAHWGGTVRLLLLGLGPPARLLGRLPSDTTLTLARSPYGSARAVLSDAVAAAVEQALVDAGGPARDEAGFERLRATVREQVVDTARYAVTVTAGILAVANSLELRLGALEAPSLLPAARDMENQLARLVHPGFVATAGAARLADVLRYLKAMERRLEQLPGDTRRDRQRMERVAALEAGYEALAQRPGSDPVALVRLRWSLEELRVSLFAQSLGTAERVSEARVGRELDRLAALP